MDIGLVRDLLISILFGLLIVLIIGAGIGGFIAYRKINKTVQNTVDNVTRPARLAQKIFAYARGGIKGVGESFGIFAGREVKHVHPTNDHR